MKSSELEAEAERLSQMKPDLQRGIQDHGKQDASTEFIQTIRLLSRSHRRFTEEQKVKVFRSLIKETRITAAGVELEMYVRPTQNVWWKYRQKQSSTPASGFVCDELTDFAPKNVLITRRIGWSKSIYASMSEVDSDIVMLSGLKW